MAQRLEKKNQQIVGKVLRRGQVNLIIEEQYYQDIPKEEREQYSQFFKKIWNMPLLHNQRSTNIIQAFWKQILRRSYLANKSGACGKLVHKYGQNYRQKFSLYYPNEKPATPQSIVVYIHGGYFINGTEQAFQYLGKAFVEKGYLMCTMGFRQLPHYRWPDPYDDCHKGFQDLLKIAPQYGGDPNSIIYLTWSGGGLIALSNFFRHTAQYQKHVKLFVAVGSPWQVSIHQKKVASVFVDDPKQLSQVFPYGYMGKKLSIPINLVTGTKDKQFPQIYDHNQKYYNVYRQNGLNVTLSEVQNHDHYDLILDVDVALTKIRQFEIKNICPNNQLSRLLISQTMQFRNQLYDILKNPLWKQNVDCTLQEDRLSTVKKFRIINNLIGRNDHTENYKRIFTLFEIFGCVDSSSCTKTMTHSSSVASITFLGTQKHQYLLDQVAKGQAVYAFALTQAGGGNNLAQCGTKATYDEKTKQFIFHNETQFSKKFWCANLGMHANYALVFAKLIVKGKNQGTHAFVVKIRDQKHKPIPGIVLQDLGHKMGLNGIDNGTICFNNHRVGKDSLLNKIGDIDEQGNYSSPIKSNSQRFFKVIDRLLAGRLYIASIVSGLLKNMSIIGVTFSRYRYGVSQTGQTQIPIGNFQLQRNEVIPFVSRTITLLLFHQYCKDVFCSDQNNVQLSNLCNIDKIFFTQHVVYGGIVIRERCGGQGIISKNLIKEYIATGVGASTGQGDNKVLIIKIAKDSLKLIGSKQLALPISKITKITSVDQLKNLQVIIGLLQKRQAALFIDLTKKISQLKKQRKQPFEIMLKLTWEQMNAYSYAYGQRLLIENAYKVFNNLREPQHIYQVKNHLLINALGYLIQNLAFYAYGDLIPVDIAKKMVQLRSSIIRQAVKKVQILVHKLNVPEHALYSPLAKSDYFKHYQNLPQNPQIPPSL